MLDLFFKTDGRMGQKQFLVGFIGLSIFIFAVNSLLRWLNQTSGQTMVSFWIALIFPFLALYIIYCVYGKRLTDMGRSRGYLFAMFALEVLAVIVVMLIFGGAEYFAEFSQFERKEAIDPEITQAIIRKYQATINANMMLIRPLLMGVPILFTVWLALSPSKTKADEA